MSVVDPQRAAVFTEMAQWYDLVSIAPGGGSGYCVARVIGRLVVWRDGTVQIVGRRRP